MSDRIIDIEGIGPAYAAKLAALKITTTEGLLRLCATPQGRQGTAAQSGISEKLLLTWANMADLMRIRGIGGQYAELLHAAGVDSIKELRTRNPENLAARMQEINAARNLTHGVIVATMVGAWIHEAQGLEPRLSY